MACSFDGPLWNKNTRCLSKASFIRGEQKDGFTSALFPPLGPGLGPFSLSPPLSLLLTPPLGPFSTGCWGCEVRPLCSHVSMLVYSVRLAPFTIDVQRDWPAAFDVATPIQIWMSMGGKTHLHLYVCEFTVNAGGVCQLWVTWTFGIEMDSESS